jgi:hypothetical protein
MSREDFKKTVLGAMLPYPEGMDKIIAFNANPTN